MVRLYDESGINTVGNGIGHDISAVLDGYTQNPIILNNYYTPDPDTYQSGWVVYSLSEQEPGSHNLSVKAWDIYNNSSVEKITFVIDTVSPLYLKKVYNYRACKMLYSYPEINKNNIIDIIIVNNKTELFFNPGEKIIIPIKNEF